MSTITKALTGAHTIGSLTVSASLAANTETYDLGDDSDWSPPCAAGVFSVGSLPVEFNARNRIVIGTTVRLITRLPSAIGMALSPPNKSPSTAGPTNGTPAGASVGVQCGVEH